MADLANLFDAVLVPLELKNPHTKEPLGITFWIAPFGADGETDAWVRSKAQIARYKAGEDPVSDDVMTDIDLEANRRRAIASVRKWDLGEWSFGDINSKSPCNLENKTKIMTTDGFSWIVEQVFEEGVKLSFFTKASETN